MTLAAPPAALTGPPVATRVAAHLLHLLGDPDTHTVACTVDWTGPPDLAPALAAPSATAHAADLAPPLAFTEERAVQAACGIMHVHGLATGRPAPLAVDFATTVAGVLAAQGVSAALIARARGGRAGGVRTSVTQAALLALTQYLAAASAAAEEPVAASDVSAAVEAPRGGAGFVSADGVRVELEALDAESWIGFWRELDAPADAVRHGWRPFQARFGTAVCPLPAALADTVRAVPFARLRAAADRSGASLLPVREDPLPPGAPPPWTLTPLPGPAAPTPARPGADVPGTHLPLAGLRVVESTRRVQGPLAGHVLRLLGAEVVRVEPPGGDPMRGIPPLTQGCSARFGALNAGKDVVEIDITTPSGRRAVCELIRDADVFLHNWAPGKAARLGLDADELGRVRPGLVYAWASGWGDALGPRPPVGTDYLVQAHSGLAAAVRPEDEPPAPSLLTLTDVLGGLVSAQAVLAALLARLRTGHGRRADSSLLSAAAVVPREPRRARWGVLDRPLDTLDGHLWLDPEGRARPERIARALGVHRAADPAALAASARRRPTAELLPLLAAAGTRATPVCTDLAGLARDPRFAPVLARAPWEFA
ncbi:CoA transferase [Streptomyces sp. GMY01]|uniref:CoA transferase n=1 Tax=Streptomyces sp. GMY02 TaxID=1333528 RepID=UPI00146C4BA0|nr:CoA transferase [Streptomyces sp. GMY02]NMO36132.1 CoA transferase [Streptomyces sp. GMY02]